MKNTARRINNFIESPKKSMHVFAKNEESLEEKSSLSFMLEHSKEKSADKERNEVLFKELEVLLQNQEKNKIEINLKINEIVEENTALVISIAKKYFPINDMQAEDYIQQGYIGLLRAIDDFDYKLGYSFSTYATYWIRQSIQRYICDTNSNIRMPVHMVEKINKVKNILDDMEKEGISEPIMKINELIHRSNFSKDDMNEVLRCISLQNITSIDKPINNDNEEDTETISDRFVAAQQNIEEEYVNQDIIMNTINALMEGLTEKERYVIQERFGFNDKEKRTLNSVAQDYNVTRERIRQIESRAIKKMKAKARKLHISANTIFEK